MNSEHQNGKTETASHATVWDFVLGKGSIGGAVRSARVNCSKRRGSSPCASATWKVVRINLSICGIYTNLDPRNTDSFRQNLDPDLKAKDEIINSSRN